MLILPTGQADFAAIHRDRDQHAILANSHAIGPLFADPA